MLIFRDVPRQQSLQLTQLWVFTSLLGFSAGRIKAPRGTNSMGRRHEDGPSGRGLLGSLPTVDAGLLRSCACHSAFGTYISLRFNGLLLSLKAQWPDLQWACGPKPTTEPAVLCASVPQRSQRILWEVISNSVFDRVVGRAQASKRTLERLENELPGAQNKAKMAPWRPPGGVPGGLWAALGRGGRILSDFGCLLGSLLGPQNA